MSDRVTSIQLDDKHYVAITAVAGGYDWKVIRASPMPGPDLWNRPTVARGELPEPTVEAAFAAAQEALQELQRSE